MKRAAGLSKTISGQQDRFGSNTESDGFFRSIDKGITNKAARFLLLLGKDDAAKVMGKLASHEIEELALQISRIRRVDTHEAEALLDEFGQQFGNIERRRTPGGIDAARQILTDAFGVEQAEEILARAVPEIRPAPFAFLNDLTATQLISLLQKENPRTLALAMAYIDPYLSSRLIKSLSDENRSEVIQRMARTRSVSRDVIAMMEETLREKIRNLTVEDSVELDGKTILADMLRCMELEDEHRILADLAQLDSVLSNQIKMQLYSMDIVLKLRDRDLQKILSELSEKEVSILIKEQSAEIKDKVRGALSSRRRLLVDEETELFEVMPRSAADKVIQNFLEQIRKGELRL